MRYIRARHIKKLGACSSQYFIFTKRFGYSRVAVTEANLTRAWKHGLDLMWLASRVLHVNSINALFRRRRAVRNEYSTLCETCGWSQACFPNEMPVQQLAARNLRDLALLSTVRDALLRYQWVI